MTAASTSHRRQYMWVFLGLAVLTVLEIGVAAPQLGIAKALVVPALILLALTKAALVAFFYMHLNGETPVLRKTVLLPFFFPPFYAVVLMAEGYARLHGVF